MANISITRNCHRHCHFCFARHELSRHQVADMPLETYEAALDFLERSGLPEARLLGGEPTEHPLFCDYVNLALERGFRVLVFSGGLVPRAVLRFMSGLPEEQFSVVLNSANPDWDSAHLVARQKEMGQILGRKLMFGVNICSPDENPAYILDWVKSFDSCRTVRLGIAHPIWGASNTYFKLRGPRRIPLLENFVEEAARVGIDVGFDCGFTPCMFSREFVDSRNELFAGRAESGCTPDTSIKSTSLLSKQTEGIGVRCGSIVDILPEGECIACYSLSRFLRIPLPSSEQSRNDLVSFFDRELESVLPAGVYPECLMCLFQEKKLCNGGCRARRALRLRPDSLTLIGPERTPGQEGS